MIDFSFVCPSLSLDNVGHPITLLRYADERIVNFMKVDIERNKLQLEFIRYRKKNVDFIHVYDCVASDSIKYRSPNAYHDVSNTNHFGYVSDNLGRLAKNNEPRKYTRQGRSEPNCPTQWNYAAMYTEQRHVTAK